MRFRIDGHTPVLHQHLRWFYSPTFAEQPDIDGEDITNHSNRTSLSTLTFSEFVDSRYINLTVSRIVNGDRRNSTETDVGRYFLAASNQFGTRFAYADLLVSGKLAAHINIMGGEGITAELNDLFSTDLRKYHNSLLFRLEIFIKKNSCKIIFTQMKLNENNFTSHV